MSLNPGTKLGPYEIHSPLGAGGMGEVYRARDTRLDRDVAIKVLPESMARDPERVARFDREAKLLATLNHPHIAAIYGIEECDGRKLLVLEYVEGESLSGRLKRGPLPMEDALETAKQVAEALEAAHEKGVIHRDLKPGNIMIRADGTIKVLDFGLARAMSDDAGSAVVAGDSPTITAQFTRPGVVLGTAAYMSPEQARGRALDRRTDIWSFGCVLFECLTGAGPFAGETTTDVIAKIMERDPDYDALPERTPPRIRDLLRDALQKNHRRRLRDIGDAALVIERSVADRQTTSIAGRADFSSASRRWWMLTVFGAAVPAAAFVGWFAGRMPVEKPLLAGAKFIKLTDQVGVEYFPSLSPDGKTLVYAAQEAGQWDIFSLRVGGLNPVNLTRGSLADDAQPAFSPDGTRIVFRSERDGGGLFVMGATGESPRRIADIGFNPSWSPDGLRVVIATRECVHPFIAGIASELWVVSVATGERTKIIEGGAMQPSWSPDGKWIAYWTVRPNSGQRDVYTVSVQGGSSTAITDDSAFDWNPMWSSDGKYLYFSSDRAGEMNLWRVSVDTSTGGRLGDFEPLTAGVGASARHLSVAAAGRHIAYASQTEQGGIYRVEFNPNSGTIEGEPTPVTHLTASMGYAKVSPDGEWIACSSFVHQEDLVLLRVGGTERRQLTNDPARDRGPRWSPDGISLIFYSDRGGKYEVWSIRPDGSELRRIGEYPGASVTQPLFSPDGSRIAAYTDSGLLMFDTVPSIGQKAPELIGWHDGLRRMSPRSWSADGQIIACSVHIPGPSKGIGFYYLDQREFEHAIDGTDEAVWLKDSRRLIFTRDHGIYLYDVQSKKEKLLLDVAPAKVGHYCLSLAPEDKAIFFYQSRIESDIWLIDWE